MNTISKIMHVIAFTTICLTLHAERTLFPLQDIKLLESPFLEAQKVDIQYLMSLDADRLMAPFYREAGLTPKAKPYGNWESMGLDGHTAGHYLTALAQTVAITGDKTATERLRYMLNELKICQDASGNGFIGGTPGSKKLWSDLVTSHFTTGNGLQGKWVPWYNLHKTLAGLRDTWLLTHNQQAKQMYLKLCDWCCSIIAQLTDDQMQRMLGEEHGGMNEVLADAYAVSGEQKYLDAARRFSHLALLNPLIKEQDKLTGMHANTQIPKVIGFERIGELSNDTTWEKAAEFFWSNVSSKRSIAIGGNSVSEHFNPTNDFSSMIETKEGPETCNTYNMLKLSRMLWQRTGAAKYLEFYEKAMFNHILSSEHPHGGFVYFTPVRPRHYRVYSEAQESFWCCVGTGLENHTKYGELIYAHEQKNLLVNLFVPSVLNWKENGLVLTQTGDLSKGDQVVLKLKLKKVAKFSLKIRRPFWSKLTEFAIVVNGQPTTYTMNTDNYATLNRTWSNGDVIEIRMPMHLRAENLPDGSNWVAFEYGPWVLAAKTDTTDLKGLEAGGGRMGHVAGGPAYPIDQAPFFIVDKLDPDQLFKREGDALRFSVVGSISPDKYKNLILQPFYQIHDARYMLYWNALSPQDYVQAQEDLRHLEEERIALDQRTLDQVRPGEQQPEKDHNIQYENSQTGINMDRHWRHASGWFSYDLKKPASGLKTTLMVTYCGNDVNRTFTILLDGELLKTIKMTDGNRGKFYSQEYEIPAELVARDTDGVLTVKFEAAAGSIAGGIYDVRLLK
jgi:uncharacterized protein